MRRTSITGQRRLVQARFRNDAMQVRFFRQAFRHLDWQLGDFARAAQLAHYTANEIVKGEAPVARNAAARVAAALGLSSAELATGMRRGRFAPASGDPFTAPPEPPRSALAKTPKRKQISLSADVPACVVEIIEKLKDRRVPLTEKQKAAIQQAIA